jgi:ribosomal protein S18 acetylase RimI-like enzyme
VISEKNMKEKIEFIIRQGRESDIPVILEFTPLAWKGGYTILEQVKERYGKKCEISWEKRKIKDIEGMCKNLESVLVAETDGMVIGYASYYINEELKIGDIGNNAVVPEFRGMGVATALIGKIIEIFRERGVCLATVTTLENDTPARHVYEKNGFEEIRKSVNYAQILKR